MVDDVASAKFMWHRVKVVEITSYIPSLQLLEFDNELKEFKELKELPVDFQPRYVICSCFWDVM